MSEAASPSGEQYFVLSTGADGIHIEAYTKEKLVERLNSVDDRLGSEFNCQLPGSDPYYWGEAITIIKGEIVTPEVHKTVTEYAIK